MNEVPVTLYFKGRNYQTNVYARKDTSETQSFRRNGTSCRTMDKLIMEKSQL